jgi:CDP-diacylglycerol---glycerol-3-phosphate 3-phosphatidyltransferase
MHTRARISEQTTWSAIELSLSVDARLRGTLWQRVALARIVYGATIRLGVALGRLGISPNMLTVLSLAPSLVAAGFIQQGSFGWGALLLMLGALCDALDGTVARATGRTSRFGALLDSTVDRIVDALPLLALMVFYSHARWLAAIPALTLLAGFVVPYVRARSESLGAMLPQLPMRRPERALMVTASLLLGALPLAKELAELLLLGGLSLTAILSLWGSIVALHAAHRELGRLPPNEPRQETSQ